MVGLAGLRGLRVELGDRLLRANAVRNDAILQPSVVAGQGQCEGGCHGQIEADVEDVGWWRDIAEDSLVCRDTWVSTRACSLAFCACLPMFDMITDYRPLTVLLYTSFDHFMFMLLCF